MIIECPNCNKINSKDTIKCECGYIIKSNQETISSNQSSSKNIIVTDIKMPFI